MTDKTGKCIAVNLYNLAPGKGVIIGDSVAIAEPNFTKVNLKLKDQVGISQDPKTLGKLTNHIFQVVEFDLIRVESPLALIINGKKASADLQAGIELSTFAKSD